MRFGELRKNLVLTISAAVAAASFGCTMGDSENVVADPAGMQSYLEKGDLIPPESIRPEQSIHLFDQGLPAPTAGAELGASWRAIEYDDGEQRSLALQLGLRAQEIESSYREPLNAVIVLDHSGSMGYQQKMHFAREAAKNFIANIGFDDRVSLIIFDEYTETVFATISGAAARERSPEIDSIEPRGATDIDGALRRAFYQLSEYSSARERRYILLVTDGLPTAGETDTDEIVDNAESECGTSVVVSTIGVGSDADGELLSEIADSCSGRYNYLSSVESIQDIFIQEAQLAIQPAVEDLLLSFMADNDLDHFTKIGYAGASRISGAIEIDFGSLPSSGERVLLVEWRVPSNSSAADVAGKVSAEIDYIKGADGGAGRLSSEVDLPIEPVSGIEKGMMIRNLAVGHMLEAFIIIGLKAETLDLRLDSEDLELIRKVNEEMYNAADYAPNNNDPLFYDFRRVGRDYEDIVRSMVDDR